MVTSRPGRFTPGKRTPEPIEWEVECSSEPVSSMLYTVCSNGSLKSDLLYKNQENGRLVERDLALGPSRIFNPNMY